MIYVQRLKVLILFGGRSEEHEVSISSAHSVLQAIDRGRYYPATIGITKEGEFIPNINPGELIPTRKSVTSSSATWLPHEDVWQHDNWFEMLTNSEVVFPVLHGPGGEDGTIQGLLDTLDKRYVGSGVLGSAICMDKAITKDLLSYASIPCVPYIYFNRFDWEQSKEEMLNRAKQFPYPIFVKPTSLGSSVGISKVNGEESLINAINEGFRYGNTVIVEKGINGREIECSVLGNENLLVSQPGEIIAHAHFYDYNAKYIDNCAELLIPADLAKQVETEIKDLSLKAFQVLRCKGLARVDFFIEDKTNKVYLNEINTMPGFTPISMYPKLWVYNGLSYTELISKLIMLALED